MLKKRLFLGMLIAGGFFSCSAQSLQQARWKTYFPDPLNDSLTLRFGQDTMWALNSKGDTLVVSGFLLSGDTLTLNDISTGDYSCPGQPGIYTFSIQGNILNFVLVSDSCNDRQQITDLKWARQPDNSSLPH